MIIIKEVQESNLKSDICEGILKQLPDWFGIEAAIAEYVSMVMQIPFYAAFDGDKAVGFIAINVHNKYTSEICVMGVLEEYHRHGIGRMLVNKCEQFCIEQEMEFLTVKTLDESRESKSYEKTRKFYFTMGFKPIEVFKTLWDESNPCLFMAKYVGNG